MMDGSALRTEIVESQKFIVDLEKWKLLLVAVLAAAALGLSGQDKREPLLLALVPIVCVYVDVLVYHNGLRILAISCFLQTGEHGDDFARQYERFCERCRRVFPLEEGALALTTIVLSIAIGVLTWALKLPRGSMLYAAAAVGVLGVVVTRLIYRHHRDWLATHKEGPLGRSDNPGR